MKAYALRRAKKRHASIGRSGRFSYCQDCGKRCTASETVIRFNVVDTEKYCPACGAAHNGGPVGYYESGKTKTGDFYH
jgi:hypothetical protein